MKTFKDVFLIFVFLYFVSMMIVLGNGSSFFAHKLGGYYAPVANQIGLNTTWNFFSPDPAHTMYLRYIVYFEDEYGNPKKEPIDDYFPKMETVSNFDVHVRRFSYVMRFFTASSERLEKYFIPWLCKSNPGANRVHTEVEYHRIPSLEVASTLSHTAYQDLVQQEEINQNEFKCL